MAGHAKIILKGLFKFLLVVAFALALLVGYEWYKGYQNDQQLDEAHRTYVAAVTEGNGPLVPKTSDARPYSGYWYYNQLDAADQAAYAKIYEALYLRRDSVDLAGCGIADEAHLTKILDSVRMDCPEFTYDSGSGVYRIQNSQIISYTFEYLRTDEAAVSSYTQLNAMLQQVLDQLPQDASTEQKVRIIHDAVVGRCSYNDAAAEADDQTAIALYPDTQTAYGVLVQGSAVCGGYASAFAYLCHLANIPCIYVEGTAETDRFSGNHAWDLVQVDGVWSVVDTTWDDQEALPGGVIYAYYLISDAQHEYVTSIATPAPVPAGIEAGS